MDFYRYMRDKASSENHQINNLKVIMDFTRFLGSEGLYNLCKREQITSFLNTKIKNSQQDPDKRWITTWNHYLNRIKLFFRWLYNYHRYQQKYTQSELHASEQLLSEREWTTPDFVKIKQRPTKRLSISFSLSLKSLEHSDNPEQRSIANMVESMNEIKIALKKQQTPSDRGDNRILDMIIGVSRLATAFAQRVTEQENKLKIIVEV